LTFARKPAPVQVTWLGYVGTTGLSNIDYRLTDPYLDPPGAGDEFYSEKSIRLPHCFWCYEPDKASPGESGLPAMERGYVTFGSLNNFAKMTPPALDVWASILSAAPGSRLVLSSRQGDHRAKTLERFSRAGVDPHRIEFIGTQPVLEYLKQYNRIDIALDPFPYCGGTTTCDALWMGVPVVTLRGRTAVGRAGASILSNVGLLDWIAESPDQYVAIASGMARDLTKLKELRSSLRKRMMESPLMDGRKFASGIEEAYRAMWTHWCSR
jgi:predicted O-linked N-acetylglucosamine transferase (SPINDLY family)